MEMSGDEFVPQRDAVRCPTARAQLRANPLRGSKMIDPGAPAATNRTSYCLKKVPREVSSDHILGPVTWGTQLG